MERHRGRAGIGIIEMAPKGKKDGGERGIRTLGTTFGGTRDFQSRSFGQLGHLSVNGPCLAVRLSRDSRSRNSIDGSISSGGEGGIRTHVPRSSRDKSISSRPRYDHFGTSPHKPIRDFPAASRKRTPSWHGIQLQECRIPPPFGG